MAWEIYQLGTYVSLAAYNSKSPEPGRAADRTFKVEKSKLLYGHAVPRFRAPG